MTAMLEVKGLVKHFGGVQAVKGVDLQVAAGECVALIGPNGAGKTTSFACIAGQHVPSAGSIHWAGQRLDGLSPTQRLRAGVGRSFQVAQNFEALTVLQNLQLLMQAGRGLSAFDVLDQRHAPEAAALLERVGLAPLAHAEAAGLPYGAKKRLELAMALASQPGLLLLDEPAAGLAQAERADLMRLILSLAHPAEGQGIAVLYTEHNMDAVFGLADRVLVLIDGKLAAQGTPEQVAADPQVRSRYLGLSFAAPVLEAPHA